MPSRPIRGVRALVTARAARPGAAQARPLRIVMLLENNAYLGDTRVRSEAASLAERGHRVSVICPRGPRSTRLRERVEPGVTLYQYPAPPERGGFAGYLLEYGWSLVMMAALSLVVSMREGVDVVHAHNPPDVLVLIGSFFKLFGKRFVFDHHDLAPEMYRARFGATANPVVHRTLGWFERLSFRVADRVIATNESYRQVAISRGGVDPSDVTVVRNGPDIGVFRPMPADPDMRRGAGTVIGYVGIMGPQDGVDHLMRAVRHLVVDLGRADVLCYVVGKGDALPDLQELAARLDIEDHVVFTGWVAPEELPRYLAAMDICIDPDPSNEYNDRCTMIKMMEYMALGKPIVAFDLPEHRVSAGDAAVYASDNDDMAMARLIADLIDDPARRARMGAIGRERVAAGLAWSYQADSLVRLYDDLARLGRGEPVPKHRPNGHPSISVLIVNHSTRELLRQCLATLRRHPYTLGDMEIVVIDNASEDGSVEMLREDFPEVVVLAEKVRRGFGANQNLAAAAAGGDALFLLNPDALVHEGTIDRLAAGLVAGGVVGSAGGPIVHADGSFRQGSQNPFPTPWGIYLKALGLRRTRPTSPVGGGSTSSGWASGGACLVDRAAYEAVGGFDEGFFMYSEDVDLFARLGAEGYPVVWVADAPVTHPYPMDPEGFFRRRHIEVVRSELRYMRKHHGRLGAAVYRPGVVLDAGARVLVLSVPVVARWARQQRMGAGYGRRVHLERLRATVSAGRRPGLAELADDWNGLRREDGGRVGDIRPGGGHSGIDRIAG